MAIYHLSIKIISRGKGRSAVSAAAYRAGEKIISEYDGRINDYSRKRGIVHTEIMLPDNAPPEYSGRSVLWNAVEKVEQASNAQLAREIEVSLPVELSEAQNLSLVREYVRKNFVQNGMCADIAIHDKGDGNPHCHIMLTMRPLNKDKSWGLKERKDYALDENGERKPLIDPKTGQQKVDSRNRKQWKREYVQVNDWNFRGNAEEWREKWSEAVNAYMERENHSERIDHRSYARQGVEQIPTIHMGVAACQMEQRGIATDKGSHNRKVESINREMRQLRARIRKATEWIYSQPIEDTPKMIEVATRISKGENLNTQWKKIANLKTSAKMFNFLMENHITDIAQLADKVRNINNEFYEVSKKIKAVDRRLGTLDEHIKQADYYFEFKVIYQEYTEIKKPKKQQAFMENHSREIALFATAKEYIDGVMNGKRPIPRKTWRKEREELTAERFTLCESYYRLKDDVKNVETIRKGAEEIMCEETQREQQTRKHEMEL